MALFLATPASAASKKRSSPPPAAAAPAPAPVPPKLPPPPPLPTKARAVVVFIDAFEVPDTLTASVEQALLDEIDETPGFQSVSTTDAMGDLSALGIRPDACDREADCLAKAGRYARAHVVTDVWVTALGGAFNLSVRLLSTETGAELGRVAEPLPEDDQQRIQLLHRLVIQLLAPDSYVGEVSVQSKDVGAEVYLDDVLLGITPIDKPVKAKAGVHILRVSKEGFTDLNRFVDVVYNRATTFYVEMQDTTVAVAVNLIVSKDSGDFYIYSEEPGYEIRIDGDPAGVTPLAAALVHLTSGSHTITLRKPGKKVVQQSIKVVPGKRSDYILHRTPEGLRIDLYRVNAPTAPLPTDTTAATAFGPRPEPIRTWKTTAGIVTGSVGVVGMVVGGIYAVAAHNESQEAASIVTKINSGTVTTLVQRIQLENRLDSLNQKGPIATRNARIGLIGGGALLAVGGGLILWDIFVPTYPGDEQAASARSTWQVVPWGFGSAGVSLLGSY